MGLGGGQRVWGSGTSGMGSEQAVIPSGKEGSRRWGRVNAAVGEYRAGVRRKSWGHCRASEHPEEPSQATALALRDLPASTCGSLQQRGLEGTQKADENCG